MDMEYFETLKDASFQREVTSVIIGVINEANPGDDVKLIIEQGSVKLFINFKFEQNG